MLCTQLCTAVYFAICINQGLIKYNIYKASDGLNLQHNKIVFF